MKGRQAFASLTFVVRHLLELASSFRVSSTSTTCAVSVASDVMILESPRSSPIP